MSVDTERRRRQLERLQLIAEERLQSLTAAGLTPSNARWTAAREERDRIKEQLEGLDTA